jgi:hypothetical protein
MLSLDPLQLGKATGVLEVVAEHIGLDALFMPKMLEERYGRKKRKLYVCFVDFEKAFDCVPRKAIEWALRKKGVNDRLVGAVMRLYEGAKTKVKIGNGMSEAFNVKVGFHEGSVLSPFLFAVVMDVVCGDIMEGLLFKILYADGLVLDGGQHGRAAVKV